MAAKVAVGITYQDIMTVAAIYDIDWVELIEFLGLDPKKVWEAMVAKAIALGKTVPEFASDVQKMVLFYVKRGTKFDRADFNARSKNGASAAVIALMNQYGVISNLGGNLAPERVSVARVVITFPYIAAAAYNSRIATPIARSDNLPLVFCFPMSPSIMTDQEWTNWRSAYLKTMVRFTRTINKNFSQAGVQNPAPGGGAMIVQAAPNAMSDEFIMNTQEVYANNARNSSWSQDKRAAWRGQVNNLTKLYIAGNNVKHPAGDAKYIDPNSADTIAL